MESRSRFIPAPKVAFDTRNNRTRGWQDRGPSSRNGQARAESPRPRTRDDVDLPRTPSRAICYSCYERDHYATDCPNNRPDHIVVVRNFVALTAQEQAAVPRLAFENAVVQIHAAAERVANPPPTPSGKE